MDDEWKSGEGMTIVGLPWDWDPAMGSGMSSSHHTLANPPVKDIRIQSTIIA